MRRDKTVARILLIFSATNVVFASPAVVPQSHLDVTKAASEKRTGSEDGTTSGTTVNLPPPESESHPLSSGSRPLSSESLPPAFEYYEDMMRKFNGGSSAPGPQPESSSAPGPQPESSLAQPESSSSSSYDNPPAESGGHLPPPPPPPRPQRQNFLPSAAVPAEAGQFITDEVKHKIIVGGLVTGLFGGTAVLTYVLYVSLLSLLSTSNQVTTFWLMIFLRKSQFDQKRSSPRDLANSDVGPVGRGAGKL
jgi:hypothetical protein